MGGIFSKPKAPRPDNSILKAQEKQEARLAQEEKEQKSQISARLRARRTGGLRLLMSPARMNQEQTGGSSTKLGGGS